MANGARGITIFAVPYDSGLRGLRMGAGPEHLLQERATLVQVGTPTANPRNPICSDLSTSQVRLCD